MSGEMICFFSDLAESAVIENTPNCFSSSYDEFNQIENIDEREAYWLSQILNGYNKQESYLYRNKILKEDIIVNGTIHYKSSTDLFIETEKSIVFEIAGKIINEGSGSIILRSGIGGSQKYLNENYSIVFKGNEPQIELTGNFNNFIRLYYNPIKGQEAHKYQNPVNWNAVVIPSSKVQPYMLVNDIYDLQMINLYLSGNYALSNDIDASPTNQWDSGKGFLPLGKERHSFSGNFHGCGYTLSNLYINRPHQDYIGLFGFSSGGAFHFNEITDVSLEYFNITGNCYVGALIGSAQFTGISKIKAYEKYTVTGACYIGGLIGQSIVINKD